MSPSLPAVTGRQLIKLLKKDGWVEVRRTRHGVALAKDEPGGPRRVTVIPDRRRPLATGTLARILGPPQTGLGRTGLAELIQRYGLK